MALAGKGGASARAMNRWAGQGRAGKLPFESNPFAGEISCRAWQPGREGGVEEKLVPLAGTVMTDLAWAGLNHLRHGKNSRPWGSLAAGPPSLTGHW